MLAAALGDLVGSPLTEIQTVEQLKAAPRRKPDETAAAIPPEVQEKLVHEALDQHYRALLDEPTPMLGNVSPRAASRTLRGRENLVVGSSIWRTARVIPWTATIPWPPTISHGCGAN